MNIGLIDVDGHNLPNFALMKISAYYKSLGHNVEWATPFEVYNKIYASKVFVTSLSPTLLSNNVLMSDVTQPPIMPNQSHSRQNGLICLCCVPTIKKKCCFES